MLAEILDYKREELAATKKKYSMSELQNFAEEQGSARGFSNALRSRVDLQKTTVIAEIKRASPSRGVLCENFDPMQIANAYMRGGASCLSILTDNHFFKGSGAILDLVRRHCPLPTLRKDFIIDPYQVYESRAIGADCVLLILAALPDDGLLRELFDLVHAQGMDVLAEVHDQPELDRALALGDGLQLIGINNRNLNDFSISLDTSIDLAKSVPQDKVVISESGIHNRTDIDQLQQHNIYAYLVGESLMVADDPAQVLSEWLSAS